MSQGDDRRLSRRKRRVLDRVVALRRAQPFDTLDDVADAAPPEPEPAPAAPDLALMQDRMDALESAFEGLQDSVYRQAQRHERELAALERRLQPGEIARSLSEDARRRGI
jgi:hypothetical protein